MVVNDGLRRLAWAWDEWTRSNIFRRFAAPLLLFVPPQLSNQTDQARGPVFWFSDPSCAIGSFDVNLKILDRYSIIVDNRFPVMAGGREGYESSNDVRCRARQMSKWAILPSSS